MTCSKYRPLRAAAAAAALTLAAGAAQAACPDWTRNGTEIAYSSDELYMPQSGTLTAGGEADLAHCMDMPGIGHVAVMPDYTLDFSDNGAGRALEIRVEATCDTVLLVNDAAADWHYNDDDSGLDPRIRINGAAEGLYDIWVGTIDAELCKAEITFETF